MGLLARLGLGPKKARPVGKRLKAKREETSRSQRRNLAAKAGILIALVGLTMMAFPSSPSIEIAVHEGDIWRDDDLVAPFDFPIFKNEEELAEERRQVRLTTPPLFAEHVSAQSDLEARVDTLKAGLTEVVSAYTSWQLARERGQWERAAADSIRFINRRNFFQVRLTRSQWEYLLRSRAERLPGLTAVSRTPATGLPLDEELLRFVEQVVLAMLPDGLLNVTRDQVLTPSLVVRNQQDFTEREASLSSVRGASEGDAYMESRLRARFGAKPDTVHIGMQFYRRVLQPNYRFLEAESERNWQEQEALISPVRGRIQEGQKIIGQGEVITAIVERQLRSLSRMREEQGGDRLYWRSLLGRFLLVLATYVIFFLYLYLLRRSIFDVNRYVLLIALLISSILALVALTIRLPFDASLAVPVAIVSILLTVVFDSRVGIMGTLTLALLGALLLAYDFEFFFATIFAGTLAVFSVRDVKNRAQFYITAGLILVAYLFVSVAFNLLRVASLERFLSEIVLIVVNATLFLFAYPLLWAVERVFRVTTDVTLLELSDTNRPLLKELSLRAPGTFSHSLQVANLAEAAADAIGANALLARVGALYHDIGKMLKPEYFIENQRSGENPHDRLSPHMSALIIASHVKDGLELARQYKLPEQVVRFIPMHHGSVRMEWFYRKAVELRKPDDPEVSDTEFRYPGPIPNSRETAILMLADSVEAACRSVDKPTRKRLEAVIESILTARMSDGQLHNAPLTYADLQTIKGAFLSVISGMLHGRVKYPGQEAMIEKADQKALEEAAAPEPTAPDSSAAPASETTAAGTEPVASPDGAPPPMEVESSAPRNGIPDSVETPEQEDRPATE